MDEHQQNLDRIRKTLFAKHTPKAYWILEETCEVLQPVTYLGKSSWGGLQWEIKLPAFEKVIFKVTHFSEDYFHLTFLNRSGHVEHILCAVPTTLKTMVKDFERTVWMLRHR